MASVPTPSATEGSLAFSDFGIYEIARFLIISSLEMQSVAVGWQVYEITRQPLDLGIVGLLQFLPGVFLFLISGHTSDRFSRRKVLLLCYAGFAICSGTLFATSLHRLQSVKAIYGVMILLGIVRAFSSPAARSFLPELVTEGQLPRAIAWNATIFQAATILGPSLGGLIYALFKGPAGVYAGAVVSAVIAIFSIFRVKSHRKVTEREEVSLKTVFAGIHYIWREKIILASISLDLFAVLLGGAVALLPVYAREILHTGPWGLGLLRTAPGIGAGIMALLLVLRPLRRRIGMTMLWAVGGFGVFTILFGLSKSFLLSLVALFAIGASDMISVVIRSSLVQLGTPDAMRGRVNAVEMLFIGASNELGEFESGLTAHWFGTVPAVVMGGIGTLLVIGTWAWSFPELRKVNEFKVVNT